MVSPKLSLVVVSFNMARELPRTIRTLSPAMQRQIAACDYEILVMDNGSTEPFDSVQCAQWGENVTFHRVRDGGVSPCSAANAGIAVARGELIGVMVDGARMASPGLLWSAMVAWRLHHRPIISTLGFHLGPAVQMKSVREGYDQQAEDRLLRSVDWQSDGYRLFEISVFARASRRGWFGRIGESNTLFLPRGLWSELGGYEEKFVSPGGGLANMDVYRRACGLADSQLIVLLGTDV